MAGKYLQESYAAVVRAIQLKWTFFQSAKQDTGQAFAGVKKFMQETFLPLLFFGKSKTLPPMVEALIMLPVKKSELGLHNPVTSPAEK